MNNDVNDGYYARARRLLPLFFQMRFWRNLWFLTLLKNLLKNKLLLLKQAAAPNLNGSPRDAWGGPTYRSRFGGLWTDLSNAESVIKGKLELGLISEQEANQLKFGSKTAMSCSKMWYRTRLSIN